MTIDANSTPPVVPPLTVSPGTPRGGPSPIVSVPTEASQLPVVASSIDLSSGAVDAAGQAFNASVQAARVAGTATVPGTAPTGVGLPAAPPTIPSVQVGNGPDPR